MIIYTDYWKLSCFKVFEDGRYSLFWSKKSMEKWYLLSIFKLSMIIQDLGKMTFRAVSVFTILLSLFKSTGVVSNFSISILSAILFKLLILLGIFFNFSISYLSTSDFKWSKSDFLAESDVSIPVAFLDLLLLDEQTYLIRFLRLLLKILVLGDIQSFILCLFYLSNC